MKSLLCSLFGLSVAAMGESMGLSVWMSASTGDVLGLERALASEKSVSTLNVRGSGGQTPLMAACLHGHADVVIALLTAGADPEIGEEQGYTCLHGAGFQGRASVIRAVAAFPHFSAIVPYGRHADGYAPAHRAAWGKEKRHAEALAAFFETGVSIDIEAASGETPRVLAEKSRFRTMIDVIEEFEDKQVAAADAAREKLTRKTTEVAGEASDTILEL